MFINDFVKWLGETEVHALWINGVEVGVLMYADDKILCAESKIGLQRSLNRPSEYSKKWDLKVNEQKTKIMIFGKGKKDSNKYKFFYIGLELKIVKEFQYSGVIFHRNFSWISHQKFAIAKAIRAITIIKRALY